MKIILSGGDWKGAEIEPPCGMELLGGMAQFSTSKDSLNFPRPMVEVLGVSDIS